MSNPRPITEADVDRAYGIASLLNVVAHASRMIEMIHEDRQIAMTNSVATVLDLAAELTEELGVFLDKTAVKERADV